MASTTDTGIDQSLIKALAHPIRVRALHILNQRVGSPKDIAYEIRAEVGTVAYHVRELEKAGYIELVKTEPRRGATEHFYRAIKVAVFSDQEWARIPVPLRSRIVGMELKETGRLLSDALASGSFEKRANRHHTMYEMKVDEEGWNDTMLLLERTMEQLGEIQAASEERRLGSDDAPIPLAVSLLGFEKAEN